MNPFDALLESFRQIVREEIATVIKSQPKPKLTYTTAEAADILGVPETWLASAAREGRVPCIKVGHYVRFKLADLESFIQAETKNTKAT